MYFCYLLVFKFEPRRPQIQKDHILYICIFLLESLIFEDMKCLFAFKKMLASDTPFAGSWEASLLAFCFVLESGCLLLSPVYLHLQ